MIPHDLRHYKPSEDLLAVAVEFMAYALVIAVGFDALCLIWESL